MVHLVVIATVNIGICDEKFLVLDLLPPANEVCKGYVFTGVCLSTGGGEGVSALMHAGIHPLGRYTPWQVHPLAGTPPGRYTPLGRYTYLAGTPPGQVSPPWTGMPPPSTVHAGIRSTSRRYASH